MIAAVAAACFDPVRVPLILAERPAFYLHCVAYCCTSQRHAGAAHSPHQLKQECPLPAKTTVKPVLVFVPHELTMREYELQTHVISLTVWSENMPAM